MSNSFQVLSLLWCATAANVRVSTWLQVWRAAAGTCRSVRLHPDWMASKEGSPSTEEELLPPTAAARASGRQVGCTPKRVDTLNPQTGQRRRPRARSQSAGTSPAKEPARCASMWVRMVVSLVQPAARAGSEQGQVGTGQKTRPCPTASTCIGPGPAADEAAVEALRGERGERSPPTGVPGEGAMRWRSCREVLAQQFRHTRGQTDVGPSLPHKHCTCRSSK